ncbi:uncharacterized protein L969DRAFT_226204 [Mixia osmundae IAM 14324]|uniref:uncharacterized protein n=1 Tax=Mixia osmundae (strain CBS 9802 / IAM 14324 / JCM 22182 / KY 12970) TaxID=764103 RepID=UPI0004A54AA4|nr:uncharacterized protein L969DRAFT_226204 [Mixia osmundae IAM 14324]KEI36775.1 hypothetical protein L969DRAFT_226204 [Mixia osmundae IAM 14324]
MTSGSPKWSPLRIQKRESGLSASMSDSAAAKSSPMIRLSSTGDIYAVGDDGLVDLSKPTLSPKVTEKLPSNSESRGSMLSVVQGGNGKESRKTSRTYGFVQTNKLVSGSIFKQGEAFPTSLLVTGKQSDSVLGSVFGGAKGTLAEAGNKPDPSTTRVGGLGIGLAPSVGNNEGIENLDPVQSALRKTSNSSLNSNKSGSRRSSTSAELDLPNGSDQSSKKQRHAETLNAGATWPKSSLTSSASLPASPARRGLAGPRQPATSRSASQIDGQASELSASSSSAFALCVAVNAARTRPRRKTVTWASREDVLEFDDDDNASAGVRTASWTSQTSSEGDSAERETLGNPTDISSDGQISPDVRDAAAESMQDISSCYSPKKSILQDSLSSSAGSRPLPVAPIVTHATYEVNSTSLDIQPAVLASEEYSLPDLAMYSPLLGSDFAFDAAEEPYQPSTSPALTKERVQQRVRERRAAIGSPEESSECLVRQGTLVRDDAGIATRPAMRAREATVSDDLIRQLPGEAPLGSPLSQHLSGAQSALDRLAATHAFVSSSRGASIQSSDQVYFSGDPSRACTSTPAATFVTNIEKGNGRVLDLSTRSTANDFHEGTTDALDSVCNSADKSYRIKEIKRGWYGVEAASPSPSTSQDLSPGSPAPWRRVRTPQDLVGAQSKNMAA